MERSKTVDPGRELRHPLMMVSARRLPEKEEIPPDGLPGFRDRMLVFVVVLFFLWKALHWMPAHDDAAFMGLSREILFLNRHRFSLFVNARISFRTFLLDRQKGRQLKGVIPM